MTKNKNNVVMQHFRSDGKISGQTYCKHSDSLSLIAEANELKRCANLALPSEHIFTTEYLGFDEPKNSLTMKLINGTSAYDRLFNSTSVLSHIRGKSPNNKHPLMTNMIELGQWLRAYHHSSLQSDLPIESAYEIRRSFSAKIKGIRDNDLMSSDMLKKIEQRFLPELENIENATYRSQNHISVCQIHGDFILHNMMVDDKSNLHILDFGDTRIGCNIDDIVRFYSNLWAISQIGWIRKKKLRPLTEGFLQSYGLPKEAIETPYFEAMMAYNFLIHLYGHFFIKNSLSVLSNIEISMVTNTGLTWITRRIR